MAQWPRARDTAMGKCRGPTWFGLSCVIFIIFVRPLVVGGSVLRGNDLVKQYLKSRQNINFMQCFDEIREKVFIPSGNYDQNTIVSGHCNDFIPNVVYIESILSEDDILLLNIFHHCYRHVENALLGANTTTNNLYIDNEVFTSTLPDVHDRIMKATTKITESYGWRPYPGHFHSKIIYINTNSNKNIRNSPSIYKLMISISPLTTYVGGSTYHIKYIDLYKNGGIPLISTCPLEYNGGLLVQSNVEYYHDAIEHGEKNILVLEFVPSLSPGVEQPVKFTEVQPYYRKTIPAKAESKTSALDREIESLITNRKLTQDGKKKRLRNSLWYLILGLMVGVLIPMIFQYRYFS